MSQAHNRITAYPWYLGSVSDASGASDEEIAMLEEMLTASRAKLVLAVRIRKSGERAANALPRCSSNHHWQAVGQCPTGRVLVFSTKVA
jgi:hypothetical protein